MRADRRGFLRIVAGGFALLSSACAPARSREGALGIHRATRNTRLGAVGPRPRAQAPHAPFKAYAHAERIRLPPSLDRAGAALAQVCRQDRAGGRFASAPISLQQLAGILYSTNGVTGRRAWRSHTVYLRAAPSAGALYAGEVYVVAERVSGLASGLYYYGVKEHELARLRPGAFLAELGQALERPETSEGAAAAVLIGNVFRRYTWRYANRGYRYALIDAGHIGENLRLATFSAGLGELGSLRFEDDRLHRLLELDGREEAVCAVHLLGVAADASPPKRGPNRSLVERQEAEGARFSAGGSAIERYHEATKLVPGHGERVLHPPHRVRRPARGSDGGTPLSKLDPAPRLAVERAIAVRRSAARFDRLPVSLAQLGFVAEMAQGHEALRRADGIDLLLVCHRVSGLEPGLYRYEPRGHRLLALRPGDLRESMTDACLGQEMAGTAAVSFLMVGRLVEAVARGGERSYRDLLLEAGGIGQRIYLAAEAAGLVARNLAAFVDDELHALLGLDGRREAVLHLTLLGQGE